MAQHALVFAILFASGGKLCAMATGYLGLDYRDGTELVQIGPIRPSRSESWCLETLECCWKMLKLV